MKLNWIVPKGFLVFFICEVLIFSSIQTFNLAFRMDVIVSRIELGVLFFFIPFFAPLLLLFFRNSDEIPVILEKISHFLTAGLYLLTFLINQINSWQNFIFSLNLTSFIWYLTIVMPSISLILTMGNNQYLNAFLDDSHYSLNEKDKRLELLISFLFILLSTGMVPLLKYPIFYYSISFSVHICYGSLIRIAKLKTPLEEEKSKHSEYLCMIWTENFAKSEKLLKLVKDLDRAFLILLYPMGWFIWADYWTSAMHPDYYFKVFFFLLYTPFLYLGWWFYRYRGKQKKISFYLTKHMIIMGLALGHFIGFNFLAPFILGYSVGFIVTRLQQTKFRMRVWAVSLIQILLIAGFGFMLIKWIAPFLYDIGIYLTYTLILAAVILLFTIIGIFFLHNYASTKFRGSSVE